MSRYFLDIGSQSLVIRDQAGEELGHWHEARDMALAVLPDLARDAVPSYGDSTVFAAVRDEGGRLIFRATLILTARWTDNEKA